MIHLLHLEVSRLLWQRRWWLCLPLFGCTAFIACQQVYADSLNFNVQVNMWDAILMSFNNPYYFRLGFLFLFAFLVSDVFLKDIQSNYHVLVLSRRSSRVEWWCSKLLAVALTAVVYIGYGLLITLAVGAIHLPVSWGFSEHAQGIHEVAKFYGNMSAEQNPIGHALRLWGYSALGMFVFSLLPITVSLVTRKWILPLSVAGAFLMLSSVVMRGYGKAKFDLTYHMMYYLHFPFYDFPYFSFAVSFLYLMAFALITCFIGWRVVRKVDL